jgi:hypothetical protein
VVDTAIGATTWPKNKERLAALYASFPDAEKYLLEIGASKTTRDRRRAERHGVSTEEIKAWGENPFDWENRYNPPKDVSVLAYRNEPPKDLERIMQDLKTRFSRVSK